MQSNVYNTYYLHIKRILIFQEPNEEWENCKGKSLIKNLI